MISLFDQLIRLAGLGKLREKLLMELLLYTLLSLFTLFFFIDITFHTGSDIAYISLFKTVAVSVFKNFDSIIYLA